MAFPQSRACLGLTCGHLAQACCKCLLFSFRLGCLSRAAAGCPGDKNFGKFRKTRVLLQDWAELFDWAELGAKCQGQSCLVGRSPGSRSRGLGEDWRCVEPHPLRRRIWLRISLALARVLLQQPLFCEEADQVERMCHWGQEQGLGERAVVAQTTTPSVFLSSRLPCANLVSL
jgi:hypothetical protein